MPSARKLFINLLWLVAAASSAAQAAYPGSALPDPAYPGFDRNLYPGDAALPALRHSFRFTGFWLNAPPGESENTWTGKRALLRQNGFGFLVLFNGRLEAELKGKDAASLGTAEGKAAVAAAAHEGFPANVRIFLDQEEGGRLLPEQAAYIFAWTDAVSTAGARAGVYCSGVSVPDGNSTISTAQDILDRLKTERLKAEPATRTHAERLALWVANDQCPPSPGCVVAHPRLGAAFSAKGPAFVSAWQYAQSPRRPQFSAACPANHAPDGNCYAPGLPQNANSYVDLDTASSPDPSEAP
jgi:Domain of unknown function (DUF1906)